MVKWIIGGVVATVIGGTTFAVNQSDVTNNFAKNTGLSQEQANQYVNNIPQSDLQSFSKIGQSFVSDGNTIAGTVLKIDCDTYSYPWETDSLSCTSGREQFQTTGNDEIAMGNCFQALDTNLGNSAKPKIQECIADSDAVTSDLNLPIVVALSEEKALTDSKNTIAYNKSVLEAALQSK